jgi:ketosteroid isomerase-like protein
MSQENVETVKRAIAAVNERDIDAYLSCCTKDVQLSTPLAEVSGVYEGADGIRRFFADVGDTGPDFQLTIERVEAIGPDRVLAFMLVTATGRASGIPQDARTGNVYDLADGKIKRIRIFVDRDEALEAAGLSE